MPEKKKSPTVSHDGHRQRMKERYLQNGLDGFSGHEVLEMLLFYALPYRDTNGLGHVLENSFGGLTNVLEADYADLVKTPGITPHTATLLSLCGDIARRYFKELSGRVQHLHDTETLVRYVLPWFMGKREESVLLLSLDNKRKLLNATCIFEGSVNSAQFNLRIAVQQALRDNATAVVIAHNHPNGFAFPSQADLSTTRRIVDVMSPLDIRVIDHLVVAENDCLSMASIPEMKDMFQPGTSITEETKVASC